MLRSREYPETFGSTHSQFASQVTRVRSATWNRSCRLQSTNHHAIGRTGTLNWRSFSWEPGPSSSARWKPWLRFGMAGDTTRLCCVFGPGDNGGAATARSLRQYCLLGYPHRQAPSGASSIKRAPLRGPRCRCVPRSPCRSRSPGCTPGREGVASDGTAICSRTIRRQRQCLALAIFMRGTIRARTGDPLLST